MKIFSKKRVVAIIVVAAFAALVYFLPPLTPPDSKPVLRLPTSEEVNSAMPTICVGGFLLFFIGMIPLLIWSDSVTEKKNRPIKATWRQIDQTTPLSVWRISDDGSWKGLLAKTTVGAVLTASPSGFAVPLPPDVGPQNGIVVTEATYQQTGQIYSQSAFEKIFLMPDMHDSPNTKKRTIDLVGICRNINHVGSRLSTG